MMNELEELRRRFKGYIPSVSEKKHEYAVLCPLLERPSGELHFLFEVRAASIRQGGEVCFPGGRMEAGETPEICALRETEEELSIPPSEVEILGISDVIFNQRSFLIHPILGLVSQKGFQNIRPSPAEVAETFTVPFSFFCEKEPEVYTYRLVPEQPKDFPYEAVGISNEYSWANGKVDIPIWYWENRVIWGLTARMIRVIISHYGRENPQF